MEGFNVNENFDQSLKRYGWKSDQLHRDLHKWRVSISITPIRMILVLDAPKKWLNFQMDVKSDFVKGQEVYVTQLPKISCPIYKET